MGANDWKIVSGWPPQPRNLGSEMGQLTQSLRDLAQSQTASYLSGQKQLYKWQLGRLPQDYATVMDLMRQNNTLDRQASMDFLANHGQEAQDSMLQGNPALSARLGQIDALAQATGRTPEMTALLDQQALQGLQLGGQLTPEESRVADQSSRAAFAARGMAMGKPSAIAEILNRTGASDARLRERQGFAASREAGNRQFTQSATQIADGTNMGMKILGMPTGSSAGLGNVMGFIQGVRTPDPSSLYSAGLGYASDLNNTNFNADWSNYTGAMNRAYAQRYGGMGGGGGGMLGGLASGAMSGAAAGTMVSPGYGTAIGAVLGGALGAMGSR